MSKLTSRIILVVIGSLIIVVATISNTFRVSRCGNFDKFVKDAEIAMTASSLHKNPSDSSHIIAHRGAVKSQELSRAFQSLDLPNEKLRGFQSNYAEIYAKQSKLLSQFSLVHAEARDYQESLNKFGFGMEAETVKEIALNKELTKYCSGQ